MSLINTFIRVPVIIDHKDNIAPEDENGKIQNIWFSPEDGWYWCSGIITDDKAIKLIEEGYSVSCQYPITEYKENLEGKLHNGNPYDKEILNGVFEHLAIVKNPRYEGAFIAVNAFIAKNAICQNEFKENEHPRDDEGKFTKDRLKSYYNPNTETIELNGNELGFFDNKIRENGLKYYKTQLQGRTFKNKDLGEILFSRVGLNKLKSNSADINKIKAIPALKDIMENGKYKGIEELKHPREDGIIKFHRINHDVSIDGKKDNMSVLIGEDRDGNRFYNLNNRSHTAKNSSRGERAIGVADEEFSINIIPNSNPDFNPIDFINELDKGGQMDEKLKELCAGLVNAFIKAKNESGKKR